MRARLIVIAAILIALFGAGWFFFLRPDVAQLPIAAVSGKTPRITDPRVQTIPTIDIAAVDRWPNGTMPTAAAGLKVNAFATDLDHPRWLYRTAQWRCARCRDQHSPRVRLRGIHRPGSWRPWMMNNAGAGVPSANRITLLRDTRTAMASPTSRSAVPDRTEFALRYGL